MWLKQWAAFTWGKDIQPGPLRLPWVVTNWLVTLGVGVAVWLWWQTMLVPIAGVAAAGLVVSLLRFAIVIPARSKAAAALYNSVRASHKLPALTRTNPTPDPARLTISRWRGLATPAAGQVAVTEGSMASLIASRALAENDVERGIGPAAGRTVIFDWATPGINQFQVVPATDVRAQQRRAAAWINQVLAQIFPKSKTDLHATIEWAIDGEDGAAPVPTQLVIDYGANHTPDSAFRQNAEAEFDTKLRRGVTWLYDWDQVGQLTITAAADSSPEAHQQLTVRRWRTEFRTRAEKAFGFRNLGHHDLTVTEWDEAGDPARFRIDFDGGSIDPTRADEFIESLDTALATVWPDRVWLEDWSRIPTTTCTLTAVPRTHQMAQRRAEERRIRSAVAQKFPTARGGSTVNAEVLDWRTLTDDNDQPIGEKPTRVVVSFGAFDVNDDTFQLKAERHLDSLYPDTGWNYTWDTGAGTCVLLEVSALPRSVAFPAPGTDLFNELCRYAQQGTIVFGPAKGGGWASTSFGVSPHTLVGGTTGAGKSVALTIMCFWALYLPDQYDIIVCDPKRTDFTWTAEFPNVTFAATTPEITNAVEMAFKRMQANQDLLNKYGVENLSYLHEMEAAGEVPPGTAPKRTVLFFDEMASFFNASKDEDVVVLQGQARSWMEQIMMLGRAPWVNVFGAAQKPSNQNLGTSIRELFTTLIGIGWMKSNMSMQILGNTLGSMLDRKETPKGRGWFLTEGEQDKLGQVLYLPKRAEQVTWLPGQPTVPGVLDIIRERLTDLGYMQVETTRADGGVQRRWVRQDDVVVDADDTDGKALSPATDVDPWLARTPSVEELEAMLAADLASIGNLPEDSPERHSDTAH